MSAITVPSTTVLDPTSITHKELELSELLHCQVASLHHDEWTKENLQKANLLIHAALQSQSDTADDADTKVCSAIDLLVDGVLSEFVAKQQFGFKEGKTAHTRVGQENHFAHVAAIGLGCLCSLPLDCDNPSFIFKSSESSSADAKPNLSNAAASRLGKSVASVVSSVKCSSAALCLKEVPITPRGLQAFLESLFISLSPDQRFKSKSAPAHNLQSLQINVSSSHCKHSEEFDFYVNRARIIARGVHMARELVNAPPNYCNPCSMALCAEGIAKTHGLKANILNQDELAKLGMGAFVAVGKGSLYPAHLIHLTYSPPPASDGKPPKRIAFVGKGITMDTGGYNLKVNAMIELMKWDMGAAGAILGAAHAVGDLKPHGVEVHFIVAAAENMISKNAYRPGDVLTAGNGTTIEVGNTDAEGRLVLCDTLVYTEKQGMDLIVDMATLTGACMMGLGRNIAAVYGSDSRFVQVLLDSAQRAGECLWPMPLFTHYRADLESKLADITNAASVRFGGSIHAALFLKEFVKSTPWCHIDMPGPTWDYKEQQATGFGVRTITEVVQAAGKGCLPVTFPK